MPNVSAYKLKYFVWNQETSNPNPGGEVNVLAPTALQAAGKLRNHLPNVTIEITSVEKLAVINIW